MALHIKTTLQSNLFYWKSEGKKAELDFILEKNDHVHPIEVKAGINTKSKSLQSYANQFQHNHLFRTTLLNLKKNGSIVNIPLYMISQIETFLKV